MRTQEEIAARVDAARERLFDFTVEVLTPYLVFEHAKPYLKDGVKPSDWGPLGQRRSSIVAAAKKYMAFAWEKALDHRGLSASRSVSKMTNYAWLLGADDLVGRIERDEIAYPNYGAPILAAICNEFGWTIPDNEEAKRMIAGRRCSDDCMDGCGR